VTKFAVEGLLLSVATEVEESRQEPRVDEDFRRLFWRGAPDGVEAVGMRAMATVLASL